MWPSHIFAIVCYLELWCGEVVWKWTASLLARDSRSRKCQHDSVHCVHSGCYGAMFIASKSNRQVENNIIIIIQYYCLSFLPPNLEGENILTKHFCKKGSKIELVTEIPTSKNGISSVYLLFTVFCNVCLLSLRQDVLICYYCYCIYSSIRRAAYYRI